MKRASYRKAVEWIALNDETAVSEDVDTIAGYISTLLAADLFDIEPERVAKDVLRYRKEHAPAAPQAIEALRGMVSDYESKHGEA
jgi:hypothetical protein